MVVIVGVGYIIMLFIVYRLSIMENNKCFFIFLSIKLVD